MRTARTTVWCGTFIRIDDYGLKESNVELTGGRVWNIAEHSAVRLNDGARRYELPRAR